VAYIQSNVLPVYSHEVDYDVKMVGVVFSDFGWNNNPGTLHSKASYLEVLVVLKTTSSNHSGSDG